ncbi:MAG: glycosyltransferase [Ilumatobacter sp.]|nr:glycosyltransferase [Ilumatobacter sp.]
MPSSADVAWVVLTRGDRPDALEAAVASLRPAPVTVVVNSADTTASVPDSVDVLWAGENVGVPGGRDRGLRVTRADVVGFLDDDAEAQPGLEVEVSRAFAADEQLGAVALRLVDEHGSTARRHTPRVGSHGADEPGEVALFLGGACAIRRAAYEQAGGYWTDLFFGHEEVELAWRLIDHGWRIRYLPDVTVFHPRTEIGRHPDGWRMTGRNRVMIARRTLPWPIAAAHVAIWLLLGVVRAPGATNRRAYLAGWRAGWRQPVDRAPIRWSTVLRLTKLGRPPVV